MTVTYTIARLAGIAFVALLAGCAGAPRHEAAAGLDVIIRNGVVYDGSGGPGRRVDVGIDGDRVAALADLAGATAPLEIDAQGQAVAPGFINVLSWATESLFVDGRGMSDIKQGVTLEILGEGESGGPLTESMKAEIRKQQRDYTYDIDWTTLGEYLESLERMRDLVRIAMREGALGVGSSLIYAPAFFTETDELTALARVAAEYGGGCVSHIRNESQGIGEANWGRMREAIAKIQQARADGLSVSANMHSYTAAATGLDAALGVQAGGLDAWVERLRDPALRARIVADMRSPPAGEENLFRMAASPDRVKFIGFRERSSNRSPARRSSRSWRSAARAQRTRSSTSSSRITHASTPSIS